jgi:hypothetical protein
MAPSIVACQKQWFMSPWVVEKSDAKSFAYTPLATPSTVDDGDAKVLCLNLENTSGRAAKSGEDENVHPELCEDVEFEDGLSD